MGHGRERLGHDEVRGHGPGWERHDSGRLFSGALLVDDLHLRHGCDNVLFCDKRLKTPYRRHPATSIFRPSWQRKLEQDEIAVPGMRPTPASPG